MNISFNSQWIYEPQRPNCVKTVTNHNTLGIYPRKSPSNILEAPICMQMVVGNGHVSPKYARYEQNSFSGAGRIWQFCDWWFLGAVDHMAAPAMLTLGTYVCTKTPIYFSYMGPRSAYIAPKLNKSPILVRCVYSAGILWCIFKAITILMYCLHIYQQKHTFVGQVR